MSDATVSICVPAYNVEHYISECVRSALSSDYERVEVVVVDDASCDGTVSQLETISDPRLRLEQNSRNLGRAENLRRSIELSRNELITVLPADCALPVDSITRRVMALFELEDGVFVFGGADFIGPRGEQLGHHRPFPTDRSFHGSDAFGALLPGNPIYASTCLFTRNAYESSGGIRVDSAPSHRDWDLFLRMSLKGAIAYLAEAVSLERQHHHNFTDQGRQAQVLELHALVTLQEVRRWLAIEKPELLGLLDRAQEHWAYDRLVNVLQARAGVGYLSAGRALGLALAARPPSVSSPRYSAAFTGALLLSLFPNFITEPLLRLPVARLREARRRKRLRRGVGLLP